MERTTKIELGIASLTHLLLAPLGFLTYFRLIVIRWHTSKACELAPNPRSWLEEQTSSNFWMVDSCIHSRVNRANKSYNYISPLYNQYDSNFYSNFDWIIVVQS